jgi:hypothetical protein
VRKQYIVRLSEAERAALRTQIGCGEAPARTLSHARILLKANQGEGGPGETDAVIAGAVEVNPSTVFRVRRRYATEGLAASLRPKPSDRVYTRTLDGAAEAHLIALAWSTPPAGRQRWTMRLLADRLVQLEVVDTVSHETVRRTLEQTNSSPG